MKVWETNRDIRCNLCKDRTPIHDKTYCMTCALDMAFSYEPLPPHLDRLGKLLESMCGLMDDINLRLRRLEVYAGDFEFDKRIYLLERKVYGQTVFTAETEPAVIDHSARKLPFRDTGETVCYLIYNPMGDCFKVGFSSNPNARLQAMKTAAPLARLYHVYPSENARQMESDLKSKLRPYHIAGEWYRIPKSYFEDLTGLAYPE